MLGKMLPSRKPANKKGLGAEFKIYSPRYATTEWPCQTKIATLFNWIQALFNCGKFNAYLQNGL